MTLIAFFCMIALTLKQVETCLEIMIINFGYAFYNFELVLKNGCNNSNSRIAIFQTSSELFLMYNSFAINLKKIAQILCQVI